MHPVKTGQVTDLYDRVLHDDHNCDTFYFGFVRAANVVADFIKNLFRL